MLPENILLTKSPGLDLRKFLAEKKYSNVVILTDDNTEVYCYPLLKDFLPGYSSITIQSGEEAKNLQTCAVIWQAMTDYKLDRHSVLVIIGGGVLGDMGGFCAATYKRGINFILIPTTLLGQADSSIGGKLGIDFNNFKNHIGTFREPSLNLIYSGFLKTLPQAELRSGFAEVIKHALISDQSLWNEIRTKSLKDQPWDKLVRHSIEFKSSVITKDPYEKGLRKILNAGHTVGHALESFFLAGGDKILHGEAIAAGLVAEAYLATMRNTLSEDALNEISTYIIDLFGKLNIPEDRLNEISEICLQDKKNKGNSVLAVLPDGIGRATWDVEISLDEIVDCLAYYRKLQT
jgi:3-dehydroquinate synthase